MLLRTSKSFGMLVVRTGNYCQRVLSTSTGQSTTAEIWDWVPPQQSTIAKPSDNYVIPVLPGVQLTADEVQQYLESQGAENPLTIDINGDLAEYKQMVIASGRSVRHIRKMTESIVAAMKERRLKNSGIEGDASDDWQLVDCKSFLVHVMLPKTRKAVNLESHWTMPVRPTVTYHPNERVYEQNFMALLKQYPVPEDYLQEADIASGEPVVKEF